MQAQSKSNQENQQDTTRKNQEQQEDVRLYANAQSINPFISTDLADNPNDANLQAKIKPTNPFLPQDAKSVNPFLPKDAKSVNPFLPKDAKSVNPFLPIGLQKKPNPFLPADAKSVNPFLPKDWQAKEDISEEKTAEQATTKIAENTIQKSAENTQNSEANTASQAVETQINQSKGQGEALNNRTRREMEGHLGADLNDVRVHTGTQAAQLNRELNAEAFAVGKDIYFDEGRYNPDSSQGKHLLAHELTHTVQQNPSIQTKIQKSPNPAPQSNAASRPVGEVSLIGENFNPLPAIAESIGASSDRRGVEIEATFGSLARGKMRVRKNARGNFETPELQGLDLQIPFLQPLVNAGIKPVLAIRIQENRITGFASIKTGERVAPNITSLLQWMQTHPTAMRWLGLGNIRMPADIVNEIQGNALKIEANNIAVRIGGFLSGTMSIGLSNTSITLRGDATVNVPRLEPIQIQFERDAEGNISGEIDAAVSIQNFTGNIHVAYQHGIVDARGTVGYSTEKMSGEVTLLLTDAETARNVTRQNLNQDQIIQAAETASGAGNPEEASTQPRALAGFGNVNFNLSEWLTGTANVAINSEGQVTIVGAITPPAEVELFAQRDYIKPIFKAEARALYGLPVVGNVFVFANIGLDAMAKIGPAKLYNIRVDGTFSTDPEVLNSFSVQASLNMSAYAGLRLRAEGGAGVQILGHDLKAGVGINALAGVRGYVEATPTIGYRETASPEAGRRGEFYIKGHMELAAQPFLGLGGDLFVEVDSPFWSPLPDKKWTWPLGQMEYPLPGEFGIGADIDYVLGSDRLPDIQFGAVDFNKDRFMTDLMNDRVPKTKKGKQEKQATFQDGQTTGQGSKDPKVNDSQGAASPPANNAQTLPDGTKKKEGELNGKQPNKTARDAQEPDIDNQDVNWSDFTLRFQDKDKTQHTLFFEGTHSNAKLYIASEKEPIEDFLEEKKQNAEKDDKEKISLAIKKYEQLKKSELELKKIEDTPIKELEKKGKRKANELREAKKVYRKDLKEFADILTKLQVDNSTTETTRTKITKQEENKLPKQVKAYPLTWLPDKNYSGRDTGGVDPEGWQLGKNYNDATDSQTWERGHLLNADFHGPDEKWNLFTAHKSINNQMAAFDSPIKPLLAKQDNLCYYITTITSYHSAPYEKIPASLSIEYGILTKKDNDEYEKNELKSQAFKQGKPEFSGEIIYNLNEKGDKEIWKAFDISRQFLMEISNVRVEILKENFKDVEDLETKMEAYYNNKLDENTVFTQKKRETFKGNMILLRGKLGKIDGKGKGKEGQILEIK